jgi:hypothetical protein
MYFTSFSPTAAPFIRTKNPVYGRRPSLTAGPKQLGRKPSTMKVYCVAVLSSVAARAGNRRFGPLSALRAHTKAPHKTDLLWGNAKSA